MSYKFEEGKDLIIDAVVEQIKEKLSPDQAENCCEFVKQFYKTVALEDLLEWNIDDLYAASVNFWTLIADRKSNEIKTRIYNPDFERHGWQSTHTIVEVICEDMPFLVDTLRLAITRMGLSIHLIIHMGGMRVKRNAKHHIEAILPRKGKPKEKDVITEAPIFIEIDRQTDHHKLESLQKEIDKVLTDNHLVFEDWQPMNDRLRQCIKEIDLLPASIDQHEIHETRAFLQWIEDHHFTFLGIRDYDLIVKGKETYLEAVPGTGFGVLRDSVSKSTSKNVASLTPEARDLLLSPRILVMSKTNTVATVHRDAYTDYIGVKRFNNKGQVIGETRIIGLYTSAAYHTNPKHIPFLRHKVAMVMENSNLPPRSHAGRVLMNILETLPRDDLIQAGEDELLEIAMGIFYMQERKRIRMFARMDVYRRFISCLVFVPRDRFNTELRQVMQKILADSFNASEVTFSTHFSESVLARIHFMIRIDPENVPEFDLREIEKKLIEAGRSWVDDLEHYLDESFGEEKGNQLFAQYRYAFPSAYLETFNARTAVYDIKHIERLSEDNTLEMNFYRPVDEQDFRFKIYQRTVTPLSDVLPILEKLGLRAISERPYAIKLENGRLIWINDFTLSYCKAMEFELDEIKELFQNAFSRIWFGEVENDGFNQLVLGAGLNWNQVNVLRTYSRYFKQIGSTFSQDYIESALNNNPKIAIKLVRLFELRFNPQGNKNREDQFNELVSEILTDLDDVANLDEDRIIRQYIHGISSTLRTNYYQTNENAGSKAYISLKINSKTIPGVPRPYPMCEIFVYSPRFEGIHLRGGKVARGGLRWSDRREDFRTEVLGLMKAQQVKNAVIVPSGAKGGFVAKQLPINGGREEILAEGIACYQNFVRGLLDITDNLKDAQVIKPHQVLCYDEDDPYLVVAADKGTATFSDIANAISAEYDFWLGDAFASGGSMGYDHKKMGITAKGAWESVKRHFYELNMDIATTDFTVVGIGDLSGDVFGNGMLLSKHIKLLAAFNHVHIFIDPSPDPEVSFAERKRMFDLPRSSWMDYDKKLISKGGGVFNRNAKSITVTKEMKQVFGIKQTVIEPNELIKILLKAPVDLLWSAGIGTFVKATTENNADVGDRTNDAIRISADQLQCKVVGEGGNLGLTQLARMEYSANGGLINTDFIDNSAGVNCSDKEVNTKILLDGVVANGDMTIKQRNELLVEMTDEVSKLVLQDNYVTTRAISLMAAQASRTIELHSRYINELERAGKLDRDLEFLPNEKTLMEHKLMGRGLSRPGLAVLLCYSKTILKEQILDSDVPEDPYLKNILQEAFPPKLKQRFSKEMLNHPLRREIIATRISNIMINEMGFTFVYRLQDETGAPVSAIVRAYMITRCILGLEEIFKKLEELGSALSSEKQMEILLQYVRLSRRITRWFLRTQRMHLDITQAVKKYGSDIARMKTAMPEVFTEDLRNLYEEQFKEQVQAGVPEEMAHEITITRGLFAATDIVEVANEMQVDVVKVAQVYFNIGSFLDLGWIRTQVIMHPTENHWEVLSREALRDDLDWQQRQLTAGILSNGLKKLDFIEVFQRWSDKYAALIGRWQHILADLRASNSLSFIMFFVAIRELLDLTQTTMQLAGKTLEKETVLEK